MTTADNTNVWAVVLGATSAMARALAIELGRNGYNVITGARDQEENERIAADLALRTGCEAHALKFDAADYDSHPAFLEQCQAIAGEGLGLLAICFGYMDEQEEAQKNPASARRTIDVNLTGTISITEPFAALLEERKQGTVVIVSSVAGDRGRQSNYIYGASKAGLSTYAGGLRNRLYHAGVHVLTVKPGFVDTKMTWGTVAFAADPADVAEQIMTGIRKRKNTIYTPFFWRYIMLIIQHIPDFQFKRMTM